MNRRIHVKIKEEQLKPKACPKIIARHKRTLSRSTINMDILICRRMSPHGIFLRMIHHLLWMGRYQEQEDHSRSPKGGRQKVYKTEANVLPDQTPIMAQIIQWNCRGLKVNLTETTLLVQAFLPIAVGSTILARDDILHSCVNLNTSAGDCCAHLFG